MTRSFEYAWTLVIQLTVLLQYKLNKLFHWVNAF